MSLHILARLNRFFKKPKKMWSESSLTYLEWVFNEFLKDQKSFIYLQYLIKIWGQSFSFNTNGQLSTTFHRIPTKKASAFRHICF